jgi:hypothetical protein
LITSDPYITITDSTELYSAIPAGDTVTIDNAYTFTVSDTVPDGHQVQFILKAVSGTTWLSEFTITCYAPVLAAGGLVIDDIAGGNGNGRLDPGETVTFIIPSFNNGTSACTNTTGIITSTSPWINILSPAYQLGTLAAGSSANAQFTVEVSNDAPAATIVEVMYLISAGGYQESITYYPTIKLIVEDFEAGNFTRFPWTTFGLYLWQISNESPMEGVYCSKSAAIGDNKQSSMSIMLTLLQNDSISFYSKVSSEAIFDKMQFFIDIQPMEEWSGELPWQRHSYPVAAGVHTFKWLYSKDMATSAGSDCAWVDFIVFPAFVDYTGTDDVTENGFTMNLSPNPATEKISVEATLKMQCKYVLQVFNTIGKAVITTKGITTESEGRIRNTLDVSALKPGYYTCEIKSGNINLFRSFIVY